jgi:energy-coupling factor transporter ATP-binding protein EcfA2
MAIFDLHSLGWLAFQKLCLTVTREVLGQTVQAFLGSKDAGRDGGFAGRWSPRAGEDLQGKFVIQCKFTSKHDIALRLSDLHDELVKVKRLVRRRRCDVYLLLTNFGVSGVLDERIEEEFLGTGVKQFRCFGADWISQQIQGSSRLRMLVPRVYGLGDLSQVLDTRAYAQARVLLESMREDLSKVVLTGAYDRAIKALEDHGFVLLLGEPACGKTTIAAMLAMAAIDQWKAPTMKLETSQQMVERWNPEEPAQFFWIDDAFGVTQFELPLALDWNRIFPKAKAMISAGARIVLTSRDYIYKRAKQNLKESAFPVLCESQVVIDVRDITMEERRQILYNHIKLGDQPQAFRTAIKPLLEEIASHPRFKPETARRLGNSLFTRSLFISSQGIKDYVDRQESFLGDVIQGLDKHSQACLSLIFMRNGALEIPLSLRDSETRALTRLGSDVGETLSALSALKDSLTVMVREEGQWHWKFKHPTVGDAYGSILLKNPELMDIYIQGAPPEKLLATITCGDVGIEGAVIVPHTLYELLLAKLTIFLGDSNSQDPDSPWNRKYKTYRFLAERCDRAFVEYWLDRDSKLLERVSSPGLYLYAVPEVKLAMRLFHLGLLPEQHRKTFVQTVSTYAVDGEDSYVFQNPQIRDIFSPQEKEELLLRLRTELIPNLKEVRHRWEMNHPSDEDPESYIEPFAEILSGLETDFADDEAVIATVAEEKARTEHWVKETLHEMDESRAGRGSEDSEFDLDDYGYSHSTESDVERSIFDDIDL